MTDRILGSGLLSCCTAALPSFYKDADDEGRKAGTGGGRVVGGGRKSDIKREEDPQRADWEHVKVPGGRCDSPKHKCNHPKQCFNEAAWGG